MKSLKVTLGGRRKIGKKSAYLLSFANHNIACLHLQNIYKMRVCFYMSSLKPAKYILPFYQCRQRGDFDKNPFERGDCAANIDHD